MENSCKIHIALSVGRLTKHAVIIPELQRVIVDEVIDAIRGIISNIPSQ